MKRALVLLAASMIWIGCDKAPYTGLEREFAGTWIGLNIYTVQGAAKWASAAQTTVAVSGWSLTSSSPACPYGGGGPITATASPADFEGRYWHDAAHWSGSLVCPPVNVPGVCSSMVFTFTRGGSAFNAIYDEYSESWIGNAVGCGLAPEVTSFFLGRRVGGAGLDPAFSKRWNGTATIAIPGQAPLIIYSAEIAVAASGNVAALSDLCPGSTELILVGGSGKEARVNYFVMFWYWFCLPQAIGTCESGTLMYSDLAITLSADNLTLTVHGSGTALGCGPGWGVTYDFTGT